MMWCVRSRTLGFDSPMARVWTGCFPHPSSFILHPSSLTPHPLFQRPGCLVGTGAEGGPGVVEAIDLGGFFFHGGAEGLE